MLNYIRAELYRSTKRKNLMVLGLLGIAAIVLSYILTSYNDYSRQHYYLSVAELTVGMFPFIAIILGSIFIRPKLQMKNYLQKGYPRWYVVVGDIVVATVVTVLSAAIMTAITYGVGLLLPETAEGLNIGFMLSFGGLFKIVAYVCLAVILIISGLYFFYSFGESSGVAISLTMLFYFLLPAIAGNLVEIPHWIGTVSRWIHGTWPGSWLMALIKTGSVQDWTWFGISVVLSLFVLPMIRWLVVHKKNY
ncbi:MAG: hypothetical protein Q4Q17_01785 [Tissierellia bacterium]|nr:hypothetical protein [Tissierellia bacterium]